MNSKIAKERISYVARPDSITTSEGDFLATHVAIKKLKVLEKFNVNGMAHITGGGLYENRWKVFFGRGYF